MIETDVRLENERFVAEISSRLGATCFRLYSKRYSAELLRTPRDEEDRKTNLFLFGNPILFPPNRIRDGTFTFDGRKYTFPVNEPSTRCHLHGALHSLPFEKERVEKDGVTFVFRAGKGEYLGFPHAFELKRKYRLAEEGLEEITEITNRSDERMPFLLAYHTSLRTPFQEGSPLSRLYFQAPVGRELLRGERYLPVGRYAAGRERDISLVNGTFCMDGAAVSAFYERTGDEVRLTDRGTGTQVFYRAEDAFRYWLIWRGQEPCMVAEPQTAAIDCFHLDTPAEENGLIVLESGETKTFFTLIGIRKI